MTSFAENGCVNGTYLRTFAFSQAGLGISADRFRGATGIAGESPSWTRGFAVLRASRS